MFVIKRVNDSTYYDGVDYLFNGMDEFPVLSFTAAREQQMDTFSTKEEAEIELERLRVEFVVSMEDYDFEIEEIS